MQETEKQLQNRQIQGAIKLTRGEKKKKTPLESRKLNTH